MFLKISENKTHFTCHKIHSSFRSESKIGHQALKQIRVEEYKEGFRVMVLNWLVAVFVLIKPFFLKKKKTHVNFNTYKYDVERKIIST